MAKKVLGLIGGGVCDSEGICNLWWLHRTSNTAEFDVSGLICAFSASGLNEARKLVFVTTIATLI